MKRVNAGSTAFRPMVGTAAAGIEALLEPASEGREPHVLACKTMVDEIRRDLRDVAGIVLA